MRRLVAAGAVALLASVPAAAAAPAQTETRTVTTTERQIPFTQTQQAPATTPQQNQTEAKVVATFLAVPKVKDWVGRYPKKSLVTQGTYDAQYVDWDVKVWSGPAGEIATGRVDDTTGIVTEAWTGPQVAWRMARGGPGAFGGKKINSLGVWLAFCAVFLIGLADLRRPLSLRNLDLLALLSFSVSLWYFNHGRIFTSVPLVYPGLAYLLGRMIWVGIRDRPPPVSRPLWPVWLLAAVTVFMCGFKVGLNVRDSNVIDVGYAGPIGAERIVHGQSPYGNFPVEDDLKPCGPADREGEIRARIQTNGRCEAANPNGDTYGPMSYIAYIPGYAIFGWSGQWDDLPASHFTAIAFDLLCVLGLALAGRRFGGQPARGDARLRLGCVPVHAVRLDVEHERRDHARLPDLGLLVVHLRLGAGGVRRAGVVDEVRSAAGRAAVGDLPGVPEEPTHGADLRRRFRNRDDRFASGCCCSSRTCCTLPGSSGIARSRRR